MNAPVPTPPGSPLAGPHAQQLRALAGALTPEQLQWASGFLAGYAAARGQGPTDAAPGAQAATVTVLHGSQSGNGRRLAERIVEQARAAGIAVRSAGMGDYKPADLRQETHLLVVVSTHGEGDPPDAALDLYELLHSRKAPALPGLSFAVLALGDSSYEHFCKTGRDFDAVLEKLGAARLHARGELDVDYEDAAQAWIKSALDAFGAALKASAPTSPAASGVPADVTRYARDNPLNAEVLDNLVLTGRGSDKETRHIELALAGSGLTYEPGDALAVVARNRPALVEELLSTLGLDGNAAVTIGKETQPLAQALTETLEITTLTPSFLAGWAERSQARALLDLVTDEDGQALSAYLASCQVLDVVCDYPVRGIDAQDFAGLLRRLQPRMYSIASSLRACPDEVHITVATVRYQAHGRERLGVASGFLAQCEPGARVDVYVQDNPDFRLPAGADTPIVMIGPGTGVAPFRAFVQERAALGAAGKSWLFFGDRRMRTDFLYQTEWQRALKEGQLTRMDVAFSRDQPHKVYVQQRLRERGRELWAWLEEGAHVYVCGDAAHMAGDVHAALVAIIAEHGGRDAQAAEEYLRELRRNRRYQRDVY